MRPGKTRLLWPTLLLFLLYLTFLLFYALVFNYADLSGLSNRLGSTLPALVPTPLADPALPLPLAVLLGHLRFAFFLVLPLLALAALHLLFAAGLHPVRVLYRSVQTSRSPQASHADPGPPRPRFRPELRPYLYTAALALALYYLPGLPYPSVHASGNPKQKALIPTATKLFLPSLGGCLTTPDRMATLCIPAGGLLPPLPALVTLRSIPHTLPAPGPVPPEATLIAAAEVWRHNPFTGENAELQNLLIYPATLRLSLKQAVAPAKNSTHYTEVCSWIGEEGDSVGDKNYWFCHLSDIGPGTEEKGQGYIEVQITGLDSRHQNYYVFQFPKVWANQNCVEAGGRINPNIPAIDFHSFSGACRGRPGGTVSQIGELKAPEELVPLTRPVEPESP
ncbi:hypothetical protein Ocepr_2212 [Oceanithermus profundus DSM 14977]|uniref:Uncharacterized protein n=1 Tax=Oceanithermus profundus (strain DSM 14977 / NBRC 100410 / VKM B-2274 / 506) TaxID=670487 RepID=E4UAF6_OCEP5|nr:hypothetical protein [Oceanithermus profundus]ADR37661.1 hypothetical protein Ocepr_2212 [Oceanithermus profundus DSM 14977]